MPDGVVDRPAEIWEPLLALADLAGGEWPDRARQACRYFVLGADSTSLSLGVRLLADLRDLFGQRDRMPTVDILEKLTALEEAPWADLYGKPLDARRLARELGRYDVGPIAFDVLDGSGKKAKGYTTYAKDRETVGLADAWSRYLPARAGNAGNAGNAAGQRRYPSRAVTDASVTAQDPKPALNRQVTGVTGVTGSGGYPGGRPEGDAP